MKTGLTNIYIMWCFTKKNNLWEHGIEGIVFKFESKMAFITNVVVTECRKMAGAFMILLAYNFFIDPPPTHSWALY